MHPRHGGHIEIWQQIGGVLLDGAVTGGFLLHRAGHLQKRRKIVPAVQLAIGVGSILPRHGVGSGTPRIFQNLPIFDPLTEGGHPVGRSGGTPQKRQEERHAAFLLPMIKVRNIHLNRHAHIGIAHGQKIVKVLRPGIGAQVDMNRGGCLNGHDGSSVFWDWLLSDFIIPPSLLPCQRHFPTDIHKSLFELTHSIKKAMIRCIFPPGRTDTVRKAEIRLRNRFFIPAYWLLAAVLACIVTLSLSFWQYGTAEGFTSAPWRSLGQIAWRTAAYALLGTLLDCMLNLSAAAKSLSPFALGGGLLLCWLPYLYWIFPGTVSNDSVTQVLEIIGVEKLGNANPIFQTALIYFFRGVGKLLGSADAGVFLYCMVQALLMAWLLGALLSEQRKSGAPRWLTVTSFLFYGLCPVFPLFAFCVGKDTNFSMAVLWLSLLIARRLLSQSDGEKPSRWETPCLCAAAVLCTLLRNPGFYLALLTLLILLIFSLHGKRRVEGQWKAPAWALGCILAVYGALHLLLIPALGIEPMPATENWSLPLQQVARVAATHPLTDEEAAAIDGVLELDKLAESYNGELSDPVKDLWRKDSTKEQTDAFFRTWRSLLRKYPLTCLSATFHNTYGYLCPGFLSRIKPTLLIGRQKTMTPALEAAFPYSVNVRADDLKALMNRLSDFAPFRVWIAPGLYAWACLFSLTQLLRSRKKRLLIAAVPALFSLAGCLMSAVNGYFRYAMPLYLCAPLLLWLCACSNPHTKE